MQLKNLICYKEFKIGRTAIINKDIHLANWLDNLSNIAKSGEQI